MVRVEVVTSDACERCEEATRKVHKVVDGVQGDVGELEVRERPVDEHPELVAEHGIMSTPTVIVDGRRVLAGVPSEEDLEDAIERARGGPESG